MFTDFWDRMPVGFYFLAISLFTLAALEVGYRTGRWRRARAKGEKETQVAAIVASILGLLTFLLAFTFQMASDRFNERRHAVLEEAMALGTTYLRSDVLPEPQKSEIQTLLRRYGEVRAEMIHVGSMKSALNESERLHLELWSKTVSVADQDPRSIMVGHFMESLNETIDLHAKRVFVGLESRVPDSIWFVLILLTAIGMSSFGYQSGLSRTQRSPEMVILAVAFSLVFILIIALDRGFESFLRVNQKPILDVVQMMEGTAPPRSGN